MYVLTFYTLCTVQEIQFSVSFIHCSWTFSVEWHNSCHCFAHACVSWQGSGMHQGKIGSRYHVIQENWHVSISGSHTHKSSVWIAPILYLMASSTNMGSCGYPGLPATHTWRTWRKGSWLQQSTLSTGGTGTWMTIQGLALEGNGGFCPPFSE